MEVLDKRLEIVTSIAIALASLFIAWSGYQAAAWGSIQAVKYSGAAARRADSTKNAARGGQDVLIDVMSFGRWLEAAHFDHNSLAESYRIRLRKEFKPVFDEWLQSRPLSNPNAPLTPFDVPSYAPGRLALSEAQEREAAALAEEAHAANTNSTNYVFYTLYFSTALFLDGLSTHSKSIKIRGVMVSLGIIMMTLGTLRLILAPIV